MEFVTQWFGYVQIASSGICIYIFIFIEFPRWTQLKDLLLAFSECTCYCVLADFHILRSHQCMVYCMVDKKPMTIIDLLLSLRLGFTGYEIWESFSFVKPVNKVDAGKHRCSILNIFVYYSWRSRLFVIKRSSLFSCLAIVVLDISTSMRRRIVSKSLWLWRCFFTAFKYLP